jgi:hypothetical protein
MSLATWKKEFYPVPANRVSKAKALAHSLQKWRGLTKAALKRHGVTARWAHIAGDTGDEIAIDAKSCALCVHHAWDGCKECPLALSRGGVRCDATHAGGAYSPYHAWTTSSRKDARPMIRALQAAIRYQRRLIRYQRKEKP